MSFSLRLLDKPIPPDWLIEGEQGFLIDVIIGDFREKDAVLTGFWSKEDYLQQWVEACERIVNGPTRVKAGFATAVHDPKNPKHGYVIQWWAAYKEGSDVFIESVPTVYDKSQTPIDLSKLYEYIPEREMRTQVSEWKVTVEDIKRFGKEIADIEAGDQLSPTPHRHRCKQCQGTGQVPGMIRTQGKSMGSAYGPCPNCDGIGWIENS